MLSDGVIISPDGRTGTVRQFYYGGGREVLNPEEIGTISAARYRATNPRYDRRRRFFGDLAGGKGQEKVADVLDSISRAVRGDRADVLSSPIPVQNMLLIAGGAFLAYKVLELVVKGRR